MVGWQVSVHLQRMQTEMVRANEDGRTTRRRAKSPRGKNPRRKGSPRGESSRRRGRALVHAESELGIYTPLLGDVEEISATSVSNLCSQRSPYKVIELPKADTVYPYNRSSGGLNSELRGRKRKPDVLDDNPREKKRRRTEEKTEANVSLPLEIVSRALSEALHSKARCALDLLVPDWHPCKQYDPLSDNLLNLTRVVTYTRGIDGKVGSLLTSLGHGDGDHNFLPVKFPDRNLLTLNKWCNNEVIRTLCLEGAQVFELAADSLPPNVAEESFLGNRRDTFPIRGKRSRGILPYDDEEPEADKKVMPSGSPYIFKLLRHIVLRSPLTLMEVDARSMAGFDSRINDTNLEALDMVIDLDRGSPIWLSWSQMPMLESVLLDLRIYSHDINTDRGCIGKGEIIRRAQEMGRWLRLKLLVIAGLQSYSFDTSYDTYTAELIEEADEIDGEPNWIKIFSPAVRPGGQVILVDRLMDESTDFLFLNN